MKPQQHWDHIYQTRRFDQVSWYRTHLETSLELISRAARPPDARIIDVGGGESTLVDDLLDHGYRNVTVLDVSRTALDVTRARLGRRAECVHWQVGDVTRIALPRHGYDVWHDRAVFHFLTDARDRAAYVRQVRASVAPGGHVIVATFGPAGPVQCSGLDVVRYDARGLHDAFGERFQLVEHREEMHATPFGATQQFVYCFCKVMAAPKPRRASSKRGRAQSRRT